jgi:hypothetical protein
VSARSGAGWFHSADSLPPIEEFDMIRGKTTSFTWAWAAFAGAILLSQAVAWAAKPPPPPAPTGTIYYRNDSTYFAVKPDGTGKATNILPNIAALVAPGIPDVNPADTPSGNNATHDRWWIYAGITGYYDHYVRSDGVVLDNWPHRDLFAVRSDPTRTGLVVVQLTDLYGIADIQVFSCWSNDGNNDLENSFVTAVAPDIRDAFVTESDGTTVVNEAKNDAQSPFAAGYFRTSSRLRALRSRLMGRRKRTRCDVVRVHAELHRTGAGQPELSREIRSQRGFLPGPHSGDCATLHHGMDAGVEQ